MLTSFFIAVKKRMPWLWQGVECVNSALCRGRYGAERLREIAANEAAATSEATPGYVWSLVTEADADALAAFFAAQPEESLTYFRPHPFTPKALRRMASGLSYVMFKVVDAEGAIAGYTFMRVFFTGKAFHGLYVSPDVRGKGLGGHMWALGARVAHRAGIPLSATISEDNAASLASCRRATCCRVTGNLPGGYLLVEISPRDSRQ